MCTRLRSAGQYVDEDVLSLKANAREFTLNANLSVETFDLLSSSRILSDEDKPVSLSKGSITVKPFSPTLKLETSDNRPCLNEASRNSTYSFHLNSNANVRVGNEAIETSLFSVSNITNVRNAARIIIYKERQSSSFLTEKFKPKSRRNSPIVVPSSLRGGKLVSEQRENTKQPRNKKSSKKQVRFKLESDKSYIKPRSESIHAVVNIEFENSYNLAAFLFSLMSVKADSCFSSTCFLINRCRLGTRKGASSSFDFGDGFIFFKRHGVMLKRFFPNALIPFSSLTEHGRESKVPEPAASVPSANNCSQSEIMEFEMTEAKMEDKMADVSFGKDETQINEKDLARTIQVLKNVNMNNRDRQGKDKRSFSLQDSSKQKKEIPGRSEFCMLIPNYERCNISNRIQRHA